MQVYLKLNVSRQKLCCWVGHHLCLTFSELNQCIESTLNLNFNHICFLFFCFCLNGSLPIGRKWVSYQGLILQSRIRTNVPTSLGQVNPNTMAAGNPSWHVALHQVATWTQADWNSICLRRNPGVHTTPGTEMDLLQAISSLQVVPYPQATSNFTVPSGLDYKACHGIPVGRGYFHP